MEKIKFDSGVRAFDLGTGTALRFNPGDPNLYVRFLEAGEKVSAVEKGLAAQAKDMAANGETVVTLLKDADKKMKAILRWVFGEENDFEKILGGVNLLAVGNNGKRVVSNLFAALQPILLAGAEACAREQTQAAVARANDRRKRV